MDILVNIKVILPERTSGRAALNIYYSQEQSLEAFRQVENTMSRFDPNSELSQLSRTVESAVAVSPLLFEALRFGLQVAAATEGAFDPTLGNLLIRNGFQSNYLTGQSWILPGPKTQTPSRSAKTSDFRHRNVANYRDVVLDEEKRTVLLKKPLLLDLGALAKGLAVDLAVKDLSKLELEGFYVEAGGDLFADGCNEYGEPWRIGIQHPLKADEHLATVRLSDEAICTSGSYERKSPNRPGSHHLIDPNSGESPLE